MDIVSKLVLRYLRIEDRESFFKANNANWGDFPFAHYWESLSGEDFDNDVSILPELAKGRYMPNGHVACSLLFAFNKDGEIVGRTSIRHKLTEHLLKIGGHIGYGVVPEFRKKGYATAILEKSLTYMKENLPHINDILVTCSEGNIASQKTIEKNSGVLENIIDVSGEDKTMRYWIKQGIA